MVMVREMGKKKEKAGGPPAVKLDPEFHRRLKMIAAFRGRSMTETVQSELADFMSREEKAMKEEELRRLK